MQSLITKNTSFSAVSSALLPAGSCRRKNSQPTAPF